MAAVLAVALTPALAPGSADGTVAPQKATSSTPPHDTTFVYTLCPLLARLRPAFVRATHATGQPLSVLVAVARVESRLDPHAPSSAGAIGLLQALPETAQTVGLTGAAARSNVLAAARYLRGLVGQVGSLDLAPAAYNAGPTAVERFGGAPSGQTLTNVANVRALTNRTPAPLTSWAAPADASG